MPITTLTGDLDVTHDNDNQGGHGSHVAGIAAANRYIPAGDSYSPAAETVQVTGVAPDAQLLVMKVFGKTAAPMNPTIWRLSRMLLFWVQMW